MSGRRVHTRSDDAGMSIVELLISIVVLGAVSASLLMMVSALVRNQSAATTNFDESRSLQQLSAYLPTDVAASIPTSLSADPSRTSPCPNAGGGTNVLAMTWTEVFPSGAIGTNFDASYRMQTIAGTPTLVRVTCSGTPYANTSKVVITNRFAAVPTPVVAEVNGGYVVVTVAADSGRTLQLSATSSSPTVGLTDYDEDD